MVLDLKHPPPRHVEGNPPALATALKLRRQLIFSIAIIWVNHHHLLRFTHEATAQLIWCNFAHLFFCFARACDNGLDGRNETGCGTLLCVR